ncbi:MAG: hypothetical protein D6733_03665 [Methanobacteriota archaeon]|nr:MAG: hypothetical protein D6733_03665 [Euryarchaeota archaeon]
MELVVDTNIVFSAIVKDSYTRLLLCNQNLVLYAPEALISELNEHEKEIREKSGLRGEEWGELMGLLLSKIRLVSRKDIARYLKKALEFSPDKEDAPFFAACLARDVPLWSNDKKLKEQAAVKVLTTEELVRRISGYKKRK